MGQPILLIGLMILCFSKMAERNVVRVIVGESESAITLQTDFLELFIHV